MKKHTTIITSILLLIVLSGCTGHQEPSFFDQLEITDMKGRAIRSKDLDAQLIFINFWATWCRPCLQEMPSIEKAREALEEDNIVLVAISEEKEDRISKFMNDYDYNFTYARFHGSLEEIDILSVPTTYILNTRGEILYRHVGARFWDTQGNLNLIRSFLPDTHP